MKKIHPECVVKSCLGEEGRSARGELEGATLNVRLGKDPATTRTTLIDLKEIIMRKKKYINIQVHIENNK